MSKVGDEVQVIPPKDDGSSGKTTPVNGDSKDSHVEQLSFELKQLKLQRKIYKLKKKLKDSKSHEVVSSSSSNEETDASSEEEAKGKKERKGDKRSFNTTPFNYDNLPHSSAFTLVLVGNPPISMVWTIPNGVT
jgi:ribosomal protein L24